MDWGNEQLNFYWHAKIMGTRGLQQKGFTIVELLIVVVVIAILAAITIVAYNGIQNRAKQSAAQSAAAQASKKLLAFAIDNAETYPVAAGVNGLDNLSNLGISNSGTTYQYSSNNSTSPKTFCITATTSDQSYFSSNATPNPKLGSCVGHGSGGVAAITNLLTNTSVETDALNLQNIGNVPDRTIARTAVANAYSGDYVLRVTAGPSGGLAGYGSTSPTVPIGRYTGSLWVRSNVAIGATVYFEGSAARTPVASQHGSLQVGQWTKIWQTIDTSTVGTIKVGYLSGNTVAQGQYIELDGFMLTSGGTVHNFADGDSSNWVWNGTAHNATSTGTPL